MRDVFEGLFNIAASGMLGSIIYLIVTLFRKKNRKIALVMLASFLALSILFSSLTKAFMTDNEWRKLAEEREEIVKELEYKNSELEDIISTKEDKIKDLQERVTKLKNSLEKSKSNTKNEIQNTTKVSNEPQTNVSFDEIYKSFKENELVAKDKYNNKYYTISAKINGIESDGLYNLTGGATLTMEYKVDNTIVFFLAEFEKEQEEKLKTIKVGDKITFTGKCYNGAFSDCKLK